MGMPLGLTYEEMLRTVGAVLDGTDHDLAVLDVSPHAVVIQTVGRSGRLEFGFGEIEERSRERSRLRGQGPAPQPAGAPPRFEWVLRVVGAELDRAGDSRYGLTVSRQSVSVEGAEGYQRVFDAETLAALLHEALRRRTRSRAH
jgi:hypothetical protein